MLRFRLAAAATLLFTLAAAVGAQDKQKFDARFEKDKPFYQKLTTKVEQNLKLQGNSDVSLRHEQTFYFKWTPLTVDADKSVVKQTIEGIAFKLDIGGQTIDFNSTDTNPTGPSGNPGLSEFFKGLVGLEFTITFGKNGVVEKVEGKEQAIDKLKVVNPQMEPVLRAILSDEAVKEMTDPTAGLTPPAEKAVGESWEKKSTLSLGPIGAYDRIFTYTYTGKDPQNKDFDRVEVKPTLNYKSPTAGTEGLPFKIKSGTLATKEAKQGVILFDSKNGRVQEARLNVILEGELDVTVQNQDVKIKVFQDQKTELDTSDNSFLPKK